MNDYEAELSRLIDFVRPFHAKLRMIHLASSNEFAADSILAEERIQEKLSYKVEVINREWNISYP